MQSARPAAVHIYVAIDRAPAPAVNVNENSRSRSIAMGSSYSAIVTLQPIGDARTCAYRLPRRSSSSRDARARDDLRDRLEISSSDLTVQTYVALHAHTRAKARNLGLMIMTYS